MIPKRRLVSYGPKTQSPERNFWIQRPEAKNPPKRPLLSAETGKVENRRQDPTQKRPLFDRQRLPRFEKTGWWRWYGSNWLPPTQSYRTASLPPALIAAISLSLSAACGSAIRSERAPSAATLARCGRPAGIAR